jgi:hypothetical protein
VDISHGGVEGMDDGMANDHMEEIGIQKGIKCHYPVWGRVGRSGEVCEC